MVTNASPQMKRERAVLSKEERYVLVLGGMHPNGRQLSNTEIAKHLDIDVGKVKAIVHQACAKLKAHNRNEAIFFALKKGEISLNEIYSLDEVAEHFSSLDPDILRRIAQLVRRGMKRGYLIEKDKPITLPNRRQDTLLTQAERDVLIHAGAGLTNKEISDRLCISIHAVRTYLYRTYTKLGTSRRSDAVILAVKQGEISALDIFSFDELIEILASSGAEYIEQVAQLLDQKIR